MVKDKNCGCVTVFFCREAANREEKVNYTNVFRLSVTKVVIKNIRLFQSIFCREGGKSGRKDQL